jgi:general secretion pathway protein H
MTDAQRRRACAGYTLIELLVVLLIIAFVAGVAVLNAPPPRNEARTEAERFALRLIAASEQAIMTGTAYGLSVDSEGFSFFSYSREGWMPSDIVALNEAAFPPEIGVIVDVPGSIGNSEKATAKDVGVRAPEIFFTPTGETTPLELIFQRNKQGWAVSMDRAGEVEVVEYGDS